VQPNNTPGGVSQKTTSAKSGNSRKGTPRYVQLKQPKDIMAYVQKLINELRKDSSDTAELGKVSQLLNTWLMAYKAHMDANDFKKLREELDEFKEKMAER
jgi:hypothetical protein